MTGSSENNHQISLKGLIHKLVSAIEARDPYMKGHSERVATNCVLFGRSLGLDPQEINQIYLAGLLHDIGIIYIPLEITQKTGDLTDEEMGMIEKHPLISEKIVSKYSLLNGILPIIRHHHEAVDGSGYPDGLKGDEIPLGAKIVCLVNSYDVMISARPGRQSMRVEDALTKIAGKSGKQYDKNLAEGFIRFIESKVPEKKTHIEHKEKGRVIEGKADKVAGDAEEIRKISTVDEIIQDMINRFKKGDITLPVLPKVVHDIQKVMSKPTTTVNELASIIERDAVISVRLISVSNSPMYRGTEKIFTVKQAIPRLGIKETQSIVTAIANRSLYSVKGNYYRSAMEKLWLHSLAAGYSAKAIAEELSFGETDLYFFMGLIHDIGKVLLLKTFSDIHAHNGSLDQGEVIAGIEEVHTSFGGTILRKWGFSEGLARISLLHQGPHFRQDTDKEILTVNLAGKMASKIGYSLSDHEEIELSKLDSARLLDIESYRLDKLCEETKKKMDETTHIF